MTSVLIVDDDRAMVGMVASLLGAEGERDPPSCGGAA